MRTDGAAGIGCLDLPEGGKGGDERFDLLDQLGIGGRERDEHAIEDLLKEAKARARDAARQELGVLRKPPELSR